MEDSKDLHKSFKEKLDKEHKWPTSYMFKFVAPSSKENEVKEVFADQELAIKKSKGGNYASFTIHRVMNSSDEVVDMYLKAGKIEGLIMM